MGKNGTGFLFGVILHGHHLGSQFDSLFRYSVSPPMSYINSGDVSAFSAMSTFEFLLELSLSSVFMQFWANFHKYRKDICKSFYLF